MTQREFELRSQPLGPLPIISRFPDRRAGRSQFLYLASSKLCTRESMGHLDSRDARFLIVVPRTRQEEADFRD